MDILIVHGGGKADDGESLARRLRSLAKFGRGVGRVAVAGVCPEWLSGRVVKVPCADAPSAMYKHVNILNAIFAAVDAGAVRGEFLLSSDDHIMVRETDLARLPYYYKRERIRSDADVVAAGATRTAYTFSLANTRKLLEANGLVPREWSGHVDTHLHVDDAEAVRQMVRKAPARLARFGFEPTCLFMAVRAARERIEPTFRRDIKLRKWDPAALPALLAAGMFSHDGRVGRDEAFRSWCGVLFGGTCKYERGGGR